MAAEGFGGAFSSYHVVRSQIESGKLYWAPLDPPYFEHYAFVTKRGGVVSPATAEFMRIAHRLMQRLAAVSPRTDR